MTSSTNMEIAHPAKTPKAAAVAGIIFAILFALGVTFVRLGANELGSGESLSETTWTQLKLAMALMPFSGIAFLWFLGVIRHHLGEYEDQFFATVSLGSGLLFVAMSFIAFAIAGGMMATYGNGGQLAAGVYTLNREIIAEEIVRTLVGSLGLLSAVPLATLIAALVARIPVPAPDRVDL